MSQIHIADGQSDNILDYITAKNIISDTHKKSLENTLETYNFITFADKSFSQFLEKRNRIIIPDEDDNLVEFVIFEAHKYRDTEGHKAQVYAHASYLELKKASVIFPGTFTGTASQHGGRALNDTGWEIGIVESDQSISITFDNHTNPYEYLKRIAREFELELDFRVEHNGTKITRRIVDLVERIGTWRGREVTFGKDLDGIRRVEKQDIVTALLGIAPEDENGNRLEVLVEDEEALQRWGRRDEYGNLQHLIEPYVIQSDRSEMTETEARQYTRTALDKRINTQITYETTIVDLENVPGMDNKKIRFGDTIKIKDEKFNPPLYLEARVFELERSVKSKGKKEIKLGDFIEYTEEQVHDVFNQLRKEIRARITRSEMVEHTYSKVEIDQKDQYVFDEGKAFAEAVGIEAEDNAKQFAIEQDSALKIDVEGYADGVASQAEDNAKVYADDVSAQALQQALAESVAKDTYNAKMAEIASDLSEKAGITYVDGKLQIVDGAIADLNAEIDKKADGSTVYTISEVDNMINNTVSKTQYTADINGIISDLETQGTQIGQNTQAIGLKANQSQVDALQGTVNSHDAQLLVMADEISTKVSADYVQSAIDNAVKTETYRIVARRYNGPYNTPTGLYTESGTKLNPIGNDRSYMLSVYDRNTNTWESHETYDVYLSPENADILANDLNNLDNDKLIVLIGAHAPRHNRLEGGLPEAIYRCGGSKDVFEHADWNGSHPSYILVGIPGMGEGGGKEYFAPSSVGWLDVQFFINNGNVDFNGYTDNPITKIESLSAELSVQAGKIEAKADSSTVNALGARVSTAETKISGLEGEITSKVSTTQFNTLSGTVSNLQSTVTQQAGLIAQKVDDGQVRSIFTQEANSFTFQADQINFDGHVFGGNATFKGHLQGATGTFSGEIETSKLRVRAKSVHDFDNFGIEIETAQWQASTTNPYKRTGFIDLNTGNDSLEISRRDLNNNQKPLAGFSLDAEMIDLYGKLTLMPNANDGYANILSLNGGNLDHAYMEFHRNWLGRSAYIGIGSRNSNQFVINAENLSEGILLTGGNVTVRNRLINLPAYNNTTGSPANAYVASNGYFGRSTSAKKYKDFIEKANVDYKRILEIEPHSWYDKGEIKRNGGSIEGLKRYYGAIADHFEDVGLSEYVVYDEETGAVENFNDRAWILLIPNINDIKGDLEKLETENQLLKNELKIIKEMIS
ncbi:phage tail spike protein [Amphibacillus xylanus]|uniref:Tail spike domain-containing protein n=1 Tax=Amphibacillus xylanus (strain ATCC 51415 / DSM 6626 / JCM 7361 / LMG 17667 / NBRC 15112 / Ep01) TaxID=698758 RepID=K0J1J1_AMPXN|nr:phage tail spike protein [Amphibacillus xylanus]BAM46356.1 hypothetical protein AXY_02240 [Amphibacillus xylanus NBRC 15112]